MAELSYEDIRFEETDEQILVHFLRLYEFSLKKEELKRIGSYEIKEGVLFFPDLSQEKAERGIAKILNRGFTHLTNKLTKNPVLYVHKNSDIPLIGCLSFGIVDKGSSLLEIKPLTSCNADCTFCSVDEGPSSRKKLDIVVEKDYLVEEVKKLIEFKQHDMHLYINPHGEPTLYKDLVELIRDLANIKQVKEISLITNMMNVTKPLADKLIEAGLTSFNVSFHSLDKEQARSLFHTPGYNVERVKKMLLYLKGKIEVIIAPVYLPKINEKDVEEIVAFGKEHGFSVMIQNFLYNKRGRNPVKEVPFSKFEVFLKELEEKYQVSLLPSLKLEKTKEYPKPFKSGDVIEATLVSPGRYPGEWIGVSKGRCILVRGDFAKRYRQKVQITKDTHNVFYAKKA